MEILQRIYFAFVEIFSLLLLEFIIHLSTLYSHHAMDESRLPLGFIQHFIKKYISLSQTSQRIAQVIQKLHHQSR